MSDKETPIEQWIEDAERKASIESPLYNAKHGFKNGCKQLLTYLGLADIEDPKKWVEEINQSSAILPLMEGMINFLNDVKNEGKSFTSRITMLEEENDAVDIVLWACPADVAQNPIQRIIDLGKERNQLQAENEQLKEALTNIERLCDNQNDSHEGIWHLTYQALKGE